MVMDKRVELIYGLRLGRYEDRKWKVLKSFIPMDGRLLFKITFVAAFVHCRN